VVGVGVGDNERRDPCDSTEAKHLKDDFYASGIKDDGRVACD
jgi:hypothetical protein